MAETATLTLTDFLLARIAEDEAGDAGGHDYWCSWMQASEACDCPRKRMNAECEAKRRIVEECRWLIDSFGDWDAEPGAVKVWNDVNRRERSQAHGRLHILATIYADHPDYREEWRP